MLTMTTESIIDSETQAPVRGICVCRAVVVAADGEWVICEERGLMHPHCHDGVCTDVCCMQAACTRECALAEGCECGRRLCVQHFVGSEDDFASCSAINEFMCEDCHSARCNAVECWGDPDYAYDNRF